MFVRVLLQCPVDVDSQDSDGWTALHAAAHWGQEEACNLLVELMCDMSAVNNVVRGSRRTHVFHTDLIQWSTVMTCLHAYILTNHNQVSKALCICLS